MSVRSEFDVVYEALERAAQAHDQLTTDDVWPLLPNEGADLVQRNNVGKAFAEGHRRGILIATERFVKSSRPLAKGRRVQVWLSAVYRP